MNDILKRWSEIDPILDAALELAEPQRSNYVREACRGDVELLTAVRRLLAGIDDPRAVDSAALAGPMGSELAVKAAPVHAPRAIGPYRLVRELGRGGMSVVYVAERTDGAFTAKVALKVATLISPDPAARARFARERQILADLQHPNIARILDGGELPDGRPFLVMDLIDGEPIDVHCDDRGLSVAERLALVADVMAAVEHAHRNLVVHRDLKPSNVLVDREGRVALLDFGIAALLEEAAGPSLTRADARPLTPQCAAPEQFRPGPVTTTVDVYQLGVLLFRLLAGRLPYDLPAGGGHDGWRQVVEQTQPPRPSDVAPHDRRRQLRGDLDTIVLKALRKEPERRYGSAEQMLDDLRRHRAGLPVLARPDTRRYRLQKFVGRHRLPLTVATAILAVLIVSSTTIVLQARRIAAERDAARREAQTAEQVTRFLVDIFNDSAPTAGVTRDVRALDVVDRGAERIETELHDEPLVRARLLSAIGTLYHRYWRNEKARPYLQEAVAILDQQPAADTVTWARTVEELAALTIDDGYTAEEIADLERATRVLQDALGERAPETIDAVSQLATAYMFAGDLQGARETYDRALALFAAVPPSSTTVWVEQAGDMASILLARNRPREARDLLQRAYGIATTLDHPQAVFSVAGTLADMYGDQGMVDRYEPLARDVYTAGVRIFGEESANLAPSLVLIGRAEHAHGNYARARDHLQRALDLLASNEHRPAGQLEAMRLRLVELELDAGQPGAALRDARAATDVLEDIFGDRTYLTANGRLLEARALVDRGDLDAGAAILRHCREVFESRYPGRHVHGQVLEWQGRCRLAAGEPDSAFAVLTRAVAILEHSLPADHWKLARARTALGRALLAIGQTGAARDQLTRAREPLAGRGDRWERELDRTLAGL